jgi:hypothetical protein
MELLVMELLVMELLVMELLVMELLVMELLVMGLLVISGTEFLGLISDTVVVTNNIMASEIVNTQSQQCKDVTDTVADDMS